MHKFNQAKNKQKLNKVNDALIDLRNDAIRREISENENSDKVIYIMEKILDFNKQQKGLLWHPNKCSKDC